MDIITIPDAVDELRAQIAEAQRRYEHGDDLAFTITQVELQIQGTLTRSRNKDGSATLKFAVLGFGVEGTGGASDSSESSAVHTVILQLEVSDASKPGKRVSIHREATGDF